MTKTNSKTTMSGKVRGKRLTPEEHIPTAKLALRKDGGEIGVEITTGRQREVLSVEEAENRATDLRNAAVQIERFAERASRANGDEDNDTDRTPTDETPVDAPLSSV